jgi:hypothetical protein
MDAIKAMVRNGRIEPDVPLDLPEGTQLLVVPSNAAGEREDGWDNTPDGIAAWLEWYDSLEPLVFTAQERQAWQQDREARREWELAQSDKREENLRKLWE